MLCFLESEAYAIMNIVYGKPQKNAVSKQEHPLYQQRI
jgi:hypothetical protein